MRGRLLGDSFGRFIYRTGYTFGLRSVVGCRFVGENFVFAYVGFVGDGYGFYRYLD